MTVHNIRLIYYITDSNDETVIGRKSIMDLKNRFHDFDFDHVNGHYRFLYKNLNIIISAKGHVQISLITVKNPLDDIDLISKLANNINSILGIKHYSSRVVT
jgi:hypothetical protein